MDVRTLDGGSTEAGIAFFRGLDALGLKRNAQGVSIMAALGGSVRPWE